MTEHTPCIDFESLPVPSDGFLVTHFITVRDVARSRVLLRGSACRDGWSSKGPSSRRPQIDRGAEIGC